MTKKDYEVFAEMVRGSRNDIKKYREDCQPALLTMLGSVESRLCHIFSLGNARFDQGRFLKACQPKGEK